MSQTYHQSEQSLTASDKPQTISSIWSVIFTSMLGVVAMPLGDYARSIISATAVAAQWLLYTTLSASNISRRCFLPHIPDFEEALVPLAKRNALLLLFVASLQTVRFGYAASSIAPTLFFGILKALSWFFLIQSVCDST